MAVVKENNEISVVDSLLPSSPIASNKSGSDAASDTSSVGATDLSERIINDQSDSSSIQRSTNKDVEIQSPGYLKSEEYRLLFRLPSDEVLVQDFNCAFQESILLQGHMYLFVHHICFYSNIFGFETKKTIPFDEVTCVRKAKTAAIFPNAIEIVCGVKRHFFASFLSRDEAYRLIVDGWSQHSGVQGLIDHEDTKSEIRFQDELGTPERLQSVNTPERLQSVNTPERLKSVNTPERLQSVKPPSVILSSDDRNKDVLLSGEDKFLSNGKDDTVVSTGQSETQENGEDVEPVASAESLSSIQPLRWKLEDADPPKVPEYYTKVAESKFPIQAEEFFNLFFSDAAANFIETFHGRCGDKGAHLGMSMSKLDRRVIYHSSIQSSYILVQNLAAVRRFRNFEFTETVAAALHFAPATLSAALAWAVSIIYYHRWHLVIETSQEVSDVPYADYFRVQGFWDVEEDGNETSSSCILRVYVNVAFSKRTMWKGKIEQNTIDECRDAYALWLDDAHKLLKKKNLEKLEDTILIDNPIQNVILLEESDDIIEALSERFPDTTGLRIPSVASDSKDINSSVEKPVCPDPSDVTSTASLLKELFGRFCLYMKSRNHLPLIVVIASISILLLMQLSIIVLLSRTPQVHVVSQVDYMNSIGISGGTTSEKAEAVAWLEKRFHHLKDEMLMIETRLEKMRYEHTLLKSYLKGLEQLKDQNK